MHSFVLPQGASLGVIAAGSVQKRASTELQRFLMFRHARCFLFRCFFNRFLPMAAPFWTPKMVPKPVQIYGKSVGTASGQHYLKLSSNKRKTRLHESVFFEGAKVTKYAPEASQTPNQNIDQSLNGISSRL